MAFTYSAPTPAATFDIFDAPRKVLHRLHAWTMAHQTRKCLSKMTARELNDVGLTYADIDVLVRQIAKS